MPLLINEAANPFSSIYNIDIALKLITLLLFSPTYEQFWPILKVWHRCSHTQEPDSIFIPPQSFSSLFLLRKCTRVFFLPCHLPDPWASSAPPTRSPLKPTHSICWHTSLTLDNLLAVSRAAGAEVWQLLIVRVIFIEWHLKGNLRLSLLHWWAEPDWVLLIPASLLLLQVQNKRQSRNRGCCVHQIHHLTPVLWRWVYAKEFLLIKLMWATFWTNVATDI